MRLRIRRRPACISRPAPDSLPNPATLAGRLLPHVQPRSPDCGSSAPRISSPVAQTHSWPGTPRISTPAMPRPATSGRAGTTHAPGASHLWAALRYAELNPVRARMVEAAEDYAWSSARAHCGLAAPPPWLEIRAFNTDWDTRRWREHLDRADSAEAGAIRACTHTGRPLGSPDFVAELEKTLRRRLTPRRGGRPPKQKPDEAQELLFRHALAARTSG
jgi:hypothetical protein